MVIGFLRGRYKFDLEFCPPPVKFSLKMACTHTHTHTMPAPHHSAISIKALNAPPTLRPSQLTGQAFPLICYYCRLYTVQQKKRNQFSFVCVSEWWGAGVVICLERGADLHMAQLMPLPRTVSCFSKIQIGFSFLIPAHPGSPGQRAVKRVRVFVA